MPGPTLSPAEIAQLTKEKAKAEAKKGKVKAKKEEEFAGLKDK